MLIHYIQQASFICKIFSWQFYSDARTCEVFETLVIRVHEMKEKCMHNSEQDQFISKITIR